MGFKATTFVILEQMFLVTTRAFAPKSQKKFEEILLDIAFIIMLTLIGKQPGKTKLPVKKAFAGSREVIQYSEIEDTAYFFDPT